MTIKSPLFHKALITIAKQQAPASASAVASSFTAGQKIELETSASGINFSLNFS